MTIKNRKLQTPLDLCPDPNLCKTLVECYNERKTGDMELPGGNAAVTGEIMHNENVEANTSMPLDECLVCSDLKRDTVFKVLFFSFRFFFMLLLIGN